MERELFVALQSVQQEIQKCKRYSDKLLLRGRCDEAVVFKNLSEELKTASTNKDTEICIKLAKEIKEKRLAFVKEDDILYTQQKIERKILEESSNAEDKAEDKAKKEINRKINEAMCEVNRKLKIEETQENLKKEKEIQNARFKKAIDIREGLFDYDIDEKLFDYLTVRQVIKILFKSGVINYKDQLYTSIISASRKAVRWYDITIDRRDDNSEISRSARFLTIGKVIKFLERKPAALYNIE